MVINEETSVCELAQKVDVQYQGMVVPSLSKNALFKYLGVVGVESKALSLRKIKKGPLFIPLVRNKLPT